MIRRNSLRILLALTALTLAACASTPSGDPLKPQASLQCKAEPERGLGGTGIMAQERGLGGTGQKFAERGLGGTGIVGTVIGFGSICVNGVAVAYDNATPVTENGVILSAANLERGMTVAVMAAETKGKLTAQAISIAPVLVGPVTAVESASSLTVMGVRVDAMVSTGMAGDTLNVGDVVSVHGLRRPDGAIDATRIAPVPRNTPALARGAVERTGGVTRIGGVRIVRPAEMDANLSAQWALAQGDWADGALRPRVVDVGTELKDATRLSVEGYLVAQANGSYSIRGVPVRESADRPLAQTTLAKAAAGQRVQIIGTRDREGILRLETLVIPDYRNPLRAAAAESTSTAARATATTSTTTTTRDALQTDRGTYETVVTRPATTLTREATTTPTVTRPEVTRPVARPEAVRPQTIERAPTAPTRPSR